MKEFNKKQIDAVLRFVEGHPGLDFSAIDDKFDGFLENEGDFDAYFLAESNPLLEKHSGRYNVAKKLSFDDKQTKAVLRFVEEHPNVNFQTVDESLGGWLKDEAIFDKQFLDQASSPHLIKQNGLYFVDKSDSQINPQIGETKTCPHCGGIILKTAIKCKHCKRFLNEDREVNRNNHEFTISYGFENGTAYSLEIKNTSDINEILANVERQVLDQTDDDWMDIKASDGITTFTVCIRRADLDESLVSLFSHKKIVVCHDAELKMNNGKIYAIKSIPREYGRTYHVNWLDDFVWDVFEYEAFKKLLSEYYIRGAKSLEECKKVAEDEIDGLTGSRMDSTTEMSESDE